MTKTVQAFRMMDYARLQWLACKRKDMFNGQGKTNRKVQFQIVFISGKQDLGNVGNPSVWK